MVSPFSDPMRIALEEARAAARAGEVPVGAVVTHAGRVIARARNRMREGNDPTAHAELVALRAAGEVLGTSRLDECDLWVTLEPCAMCAAAAALARLAAVRFGAEDPKGGGVVHGARIFSQSTCHHRPEVFGGIGEYQSAALLRAFFAERR